MPVAAINTYLEKLEVRQAETKLMISDSVSVPHMKKSDRKKAIDSWMEIVNIPNTNQVQPARRALLKIMGIGVRYVEPG